MKRAEITRLAVAADLYSGFVSVAAIERFAALVAAAEREACAKLVWATPEPDDVAISHREAIVKAIRARGQE